MKAPSFLLYCDITWYFKKIFSRIVRFKIAFLLFFAVFLQLGFVFDGVFLAPLRFFYEDGYSLICKYLFLFLFQFVALLWVWVQRDAIQPPKISEYIHVLPINSLCYRANKFILLLLANNVFLLFYLLSLFTSNSFAGNTPIFATDGYLFLSTLFFQYFLFSRNLASIIFILIANIIFIFSLSYAVLLFPAFLMILVSLLFLRRSRGFNLNKINFRGYAKLATIFPIYNIQLKLVFYRFFQDCFLRFVVNAIILFIVIVLPVNDKTRQHLHLLQIMYFTISAFIFSGFFYKLSSSREKYAEYLRTMPYGKHFWLHHDLQFVFSFYFLGVLAYLVLNLFVFPFSFAFLVFALVLQIIFLPIYRFLHDNFSSRGGLYALVFCLFLMVIEMNLFA